MKKKTYNLLELYGCGSFKNETGREGLMYNLATNHVKIYRIGEWFAIAVYPNKDIAMGNTYWQNVGKRYFSGVVKIRFARSGVVAYRKFKNDAFIESHSSTDSA